MDKYIVILIDSLIKKNEIVDKIQDICDEQEKIVVSDDINIDKYNELMEQKGELIKQMDLLDDGFTALYARVSPQLRVSSTDYSEQILKMQQLIGDISQKITLIQAKELRIQTRIERLASLGQGKSGRHVSKQSVANRYYQTMKGSNVASSIFIDSKKRKQ